MAAMAKWLAAAKAYMRVDGEDEDAVIEGMLAACDSYMQGAGVTRGVDSALYDLVVHNMTLTLYDGRHEEKSLPISASMTPTVRMMMTQLKLRARYETGEGEA